MKAAKLLVVALLVGWVFAYFAFDLGHYFTLAYFKAEEAHIRTLYTENPWPVLLVFAFIYMIVAVPSLPGAALMTLAAGALFGVSVGTVLISLTSVIAAILTFVSSRFLFRDFMQSRFAANLRTVNAGVARDGGLYLFMLRLSPIFPFFIVNVVMGLTSIPLWTFIWVTQLGVIPGSAIFVAAGTEFADLDDLSGILSPRLALYLTLLGLLPIVTRRLVAYAKVRLLYRPFARPKHFDRNVVVIGSSAAAIVAANAASAMRARVTLVQPAATPNPATLSGAIPTKVLLRCARYLFETHRARQRGLRSAHVSVDFAELLSQAEELSETFGHHQGIAPNVDVRLGTVRVESPFTVSIDGETVTTRNIILATGSHAYIPAIKGLDQIRYETTDTLLRLRKLPAQLLILGGGHSGCELAQCFARLGSRVTMIEQQNALMAAEDPDVTALLAQQLARDGVEILLQTQIAEIAVDAQGNYAICGPSDLSGKPSVSQATTRKVAFDTLIVAAGREICTDHLNLPALGLIPEPSGRIEVNDFLQSRFPNIFACGELAAPLHFAEEATNTAWYAAMNALFRWRRYKIDYSIIPWVTMTDPVIARVGYNERQAQRDNVPYRVQRFELDEFSRRPVSSTEYQGDWTVVVKVLTEADKKKIIGVNMVGPRAEDMIAEYAALLRYGLDLPHQRAGHFHVQSPPWHATPAVRAALPAWLTPWVERFHAWQRGQAPTPP